MPLEAPAATLRLPAAESGHLSSGGQHSLFASGVESQTSSDSISVDEGDAEEGEEMEDGPSLGGGRPELTCRECGDARRFIWEFLNHDLSLPTWMWWTSIAYQLVIVLLVVALFIVDNTGGSRENFFQPAAITTFPYWVAELILTIVWSVEYLLRIWSCVEQDPRHLKGSECQARRRILLQPLMLFDLFSIISLMVDLCIESNEYRGISSLRLLTVFRIEREFNLFGPVLMVIQAKGPLLLATLGIAGVVLLIGSVTMFYIESPTNEDFSSVLNSMWWCTTALTTVGYGDIYPQTGAGRLIGSVVAFLGIGLFAMPAGIIASGFQEHWEEARRASRRRHRQARGGAATESRAPGATFNSGGSPGGPLGLDVLHRMQLQQEKMSVQLNSMSAEMAALRTELRLALAERKL